MIALLGWLGSGLVVTSLIQSDLRRLRQVNLAASIALGVFNVALGIWSMIALNIVLATVNGYHLYLAPRSRRHANATPSWSDRSGSMDPWPKSSGTESPPEPTPSVLVLR